MRTVEENGNVHHDSVHDLLPGDTCFLINPSYEIIEIKWDEDESGRIQEIREHGDIALTKKDAEYEILLRKSRAFSGGFRPKIGGNYYCFSSFGFVMSCDYDGSSGHQAYFAIGNMHPTEEQTDIWYENHGKKLFSYYE